MVKGVSWVKCSYTSMLGRIRSEWSNENGMTAVDVEIPRGATATLILPVKMAGEAGGKDQGSGPQYHELRRDDQVVVYQVGPGSYHLREAEPLPLGKGR
jgi:hypothetical protein